jgi:hypothetical protein
MHPPAWLNDEPEIKALLAAVLDRFDRQSGATRERAILLYAERHLPSLQNDNARADQLWELIRDLERGGVLAVDATKRRGYDSPWVGAKLRFWPSSEDRLREWLQRPATPAVWAQWRASVAQAGALFADGGLALSARRIAIDGRTNEQVVAAFSKLASVREPVTLRQMSAYAFWGDSKVLDDREDLVAASFPHLQVRERPIVVSVFLPATVEHVLFIENQDTYAMASLGRVAAAANHALVYMAGFRSTAQRIRRPEGVHLHFAGPGIELRAAFERWWFDDTALGDRAYFWGDLDFAGMQILKVLRQRFGAVEAWLLGYEPMVNALREGRGRAAVFAQSTRQVDPLLTGCAYADAVLLPAIREHGFLDQEHPYW